MRAAWTWGLLAALAMGQPGAARAQVTAGLAPARAAEMHVSAAMPADFAALARSQRVMLDVYVADRRIGQFEAEADPGAITFRHPDQIAAAVPDLLDRAAVAAALAGRLDPNARFRCADAVAACEHPTPAVAQIVYDGAHFRAELFVNPRLLAVHGEQGDRFLAPAPALSMVDTVGVALAGSDGQGLAYAVRNRLVAGTGAARLVSDAAIASHRGLDVDTLALELDRPNLRYGAGLFYVPGADLVGRRRIVGVGVATQFDTRTDRLALTGSPLVVFLAQRSRVDLFVQGRLVSSHVFEGGNQSLDTSGLPDGSYPVEIRIQEASGATRVEQRFFTKNATLAPVGRVLFHADAGLLAPDRGIGAMSLARIPLVSLGIAGRFGEHLAWDGAVMATNRKIVAEGGVTVLTRVAQARVALMATGSGDGGAILQLGSASGGRLSVNFDLRHVYSRDGKPLIPTDADGTIATILGQTADELLAQRAAYSQAIGSLSYALARAQIGVSGYYRQDHGRAASYAVGPSLRWSVLQRERLRLTATGTLAETDRGRSVAVGLQLELLRSRASYTVAAGAQTGAGPDGRALGDIVEATAAIQRDHVLGGDLDAAAAVQHSASGLIVQASADQRGPLGYYSANLVERSGGNGGGGGQYGLTAQTAIVIGRGRARVGTRDQTDSVIAVTVRGTAPLARFEVLIDGAVRGEIGAGGRLAIAVTPYRRYEVRVRAIGSDLLALDTSPRTVDIYPGGVAALDWTARPVLAMFGRLVRPDGAAIPDADIVTGGAIAATDAHGYFQLQAAGDAALSVHPSAGPACTARLDAHRSPQGYTPLGDVTCR